jgi:hypothetical protein
MRKDVIRDDVRRLARVDAQLDRLAGECRKHLRDRVHTHESPVQPGCDTQQCGPRLRVVRMALFGAGDENGRVQENIHFGLRLQKGLYQLLAHILDDAARTCPRLPTALMSPHTVDFDHGRFLSSAHQEYTVGLLKNLQFCVRLETEPLREMLGKDDVPRLRF